MTVLERALADMRSGLHVAVVASTGDTLDRLAVCARRLLRDGERIGWRMITDGTGTIALRLYATAGLARGLELDRVYFDHSGVYEQFAPTMCTSTAPGPRFVHGPK